MRERAASAGGELRVGVENGLRLALRLPLRDIEGRTA
jgi:signal transduction histidine kinase